MTRRVVVLGGTGLFGGHLARQLIADPQFDVICAGRTPATLEAFCAQYGGRPHSLDRQNAAQVETLLRTETPFALIDAAGPFQYYGPDPYAFARQVITAGVHYLDLADARAFVAGIDSLDGLAKQHHVTALSGASTTPALAAAVADALGAGLTVERIETAIVPGNQSPRGRAVTEAILGQIGQPFTIHRDAAPHRVTGWSDTRPITIQTDGHRITRPAAHVDTPDLALFPSRYTARTVIARAGLELPLFHHGLRAAALLVRTRLLRNLRGLTPLVHTVAGWFEGRGTDAGGMKLRVVGTTDNGTRLQRDWDLIATGGVGPQIPALPATLLTQTLATQGLPSGARPAVGDLTLAQPEAALHALGIETKTHETPLTPLFAQILGDASLPPALQALHSVHGRQSFSGTAQVDGPQTPLAALAGRIAGFPRRSEVLPVDVTIDATPDREIWRRRFGTKTFRSTLTPDPATGQAIERFGPLSFRIALAAEDGQIAYPVTAGFLLGRIPIPRGLLPVSDTREYEDDQGRFCFDVTVSLRSGARIVRYRGHLTPTAPVLRAQQSNAGAK